MNKEAKTGNYFFISSVTPHIFKLTSKNKVKELMRPSLQIHYNWAEIIFKMREQREEADDEGTTIPDF